jgi:pimeloyl-ACP methyl ester carboxylesterase
MSDAKPSAEPIRAIPPPRPDCDGNLRGTVTLSPKSCTTRAAVPIPPTKVIPVIVVPGIMGSNLCAIRAARKNKILNPGEAAWRPPNGTKAGLNEATLWKGRDPSTRQQILDPETLEVDGTGAIDGASELGIDIAQLRADGWGEIHSSSYGSLLIFLQKRLNTVFFITSYGAKVLDHDWRTLGKHDRSKWNASDSGPTAPLSTQELEKVAQYQFPIYACGYNWLESNERSADRLEKKIAAVKKYWTDAKQDCKQVILVTHSMGGLVGRACASRIPDEIVGVVHGVMPALGAPVCYRRIACGTETSSPSNYPLADIAMGKFADIAGRTAAETTPVMATAPGPLELLPNDRYPKPWLFASVMVRASRTPKDILPLPIGSSYDLYRDTTSWYRMIDPNLADPANKYGGQVLGKIKRSINQAEKFHSQILGDYYHKNTFAFFGSDGDYKSFGTFRWLAYIVTDAPPSGSFANGRLVRRTAEGYREIEEATGEKVLFLHSEQDVAGDGTVPLHSGAGPSAHVKQTFSTTGYDHQGSYSNESMLLLTLQLIARIVQDAK